MATQALLMQSCDGKLNTEMTRQSADTAQYKDQKAKDKMVSVFTNEDKNVDEQGKKSWIKAGIIASGIALTALAAFAIYKGIKANNLKAAQAELGKVVEQSSVKTYGYQTFDPHFREYDKHSYDLLTTWKEMKTADGIKSSDIKRTVFINGSIPTYKQMGSDILVNDEILHSDPSGHLRNAARTAIREAKIAENATLDSELAKYGVKFCGRVSRPDTDLVQDLLVEVKGETKRLRVNWYYTMDERYKEELVEALKRGEDITNIFR